MNCPECGDPITAVTCSINARTWEREFTTSCGHQLTRDQALAVYVVQPFHVPEINGTNLIGAERARHAAEEGHTSDSDAQLTAGELAWAAWCLIDAPGAEHPSGQAPGVWPLPRDRWPNTTDPGRLLQIAGSFIAAELDRRLTAGETP
jgi:hypothetical protein